MIGTITVNPSIDQHILIDRLVKDDAIRAREIRRDPGGKGINVSRVIKELGDETVAFGVAGGCAGYMLRGLMAEQEILFEAIEIPKETRINVILTDRSDRTQTRISAPGPWMTLDDTEQLVSKVMQFEPFPEWWVLGGSLPPGVPEDFYARLISRFQEHGARCVLDTDGAALKIGIQAKPYLIKPNEFEIERLAGRPLRDESAIVEVAREIVDGGVQVVAVTLGNKGALVVSADQALRAIAPRVEVRSKVGAGDAFLAGCVLGCFRGESLEATIRLGMAAGTAAVITEGTELCRRVDVERLLDQITIEPAEVAAGQTSKARRQLVRDVVCGMEVDLTLVDFKATHQEHEYRFCSLKCQQQFETEPERFLRKLRSRTRTP